MNLQDMVKEVCAGPRGGGERKTPAKKEGDKESGKTDAKESKKREGEISAR